MFTMKRKRHLKEKQVCLIFSFFFLLHISFSIFPRALLLVHSFTPCFLEGYERLINSKEGTSQSSGVINPSMLNTGDMFSDAEKTSQTAINASADDDDTFDIFGDEDEDTNKNPQSDNLSPLQPPETSGNAKGIPFLD